MWEDNRMLTSGIAMRAEVRHHSLFDRLQYMLGP
jgi:hypothetical protein